MFEHISFEIPNFEGDPKESYNHFEGPCMTDSLSCFMHWDFGPHIAPEQSVASGSRFGTGVAAAVGGLGAAAVLCQMPVAAVVSTTGEVRDAAVAKGIRELCLEFDNVAESTLFYFESLYVICLG
jgi:hypothetical protein